MNALTSKRKRAFSFIFLALISIVIWYRTSLNAMNTGSTCSREVLELSADIVAAFGLVCFMAAIANSVEVVEIPQGNKKQ